MPILRLFLMILGLMLVFSCGADYPEAEVNTARQAYESAKSAQAEFFAPKAFRVASNDLQVLEKELAQKQYQNIEVLAKRLLESSKVARREANVAINGFKSDFSDDIATAQILVQKLEVSFKNVENDVSPQIHYRKFSTIFRLAKERMVNAQSSFANQDYNQAKQLFTSAQKTFVDLERLLTSSGY